MSKVLTPDELGDMFLYIKDHPRIAEVFRVEKMVNAYVALLERLAEVEQESFERVTAMRLQIQDWIDEGVSRPDMQAFLDSEGRSS